MDLYFFWSSVDNSLIKHGTSLCLLFSYYQILSVAIPNSCCISDLPISSSNSDFYFKELFVMMASVSLEWSEKSKRKQLSISTIHFLIRFASSLKPLISSPFQIAANTFRDNLIKRWVEVINFKLANGHRRHQRF